MDHVEAMPERAPTPGADEGYASLDETNERVDAGLRACKARMNRPDMISRQAAAELENTSPDTIDRWIAEGRAIGIHRPGAAPVLPKWQFEPPLWSVLPRLCEALGTREGWAILQFLETPLGALQGETPRLALELGQVDDVLRCALHDAG